jgi:hypothetical protein
MLQFIDNEFYEVGNLLIASKFQVDGTGIVNLTWEVPNNMKEKIDSEFSFTLYYMISTNKLFFRLQC